MQRVIFTDSVKPLIFEALDITVGDDGFLCKDGELLIDIFDDKPMTSEEFGGISKEGAFKGSLSSLMSLVEKDNRK